MSATLQKLTGQVLDEKYRIEEKLGQGGMGAVFLATHLGTQRPVALKVIAPQFMAHPEFVERFRREAEAAGRLRHPNVVNVTDFGFARADSYQLAYLVMEYLDGCSLADLLKREGRLPLGFVVDIIEQVCSAIDRAHGQGIIHRDLKPDNIWLEPNGLGGHTVKVLDFGLAKLRDDAKLSLTSANRSPSKPSAITEVDTASGDDTPTCVQSSVHDDVDTQVLDQRVSTTNRSLSSSRAGLTQAGAILGTPLYMSPEQCRGEDLDARADIYSLGVITYQMLTGETPFTGNMNALMLKHAEEPPPPIREKNHDIPGGVAALVMSALAKTLEERPTSAASFASALKANAEGTGTLLRQSITMYNEHLPIFLRISLIAHAPAIVTRIIALAMMQIFGQNSAPLSFANIGVYFADVFAFIVNAGVLVSVVSQLMTAPLKAVSVTAAFNDLKARVRSFVPATLWFLLFTITAEVLYVIPFVVLSGDRDISVRRGMMSASWDHDIPLYIIIVIVLSVLVLAWPGVRNQLLYSVYAPAIMIEGLGGRAALKRSKQLMKRARRSIKTMIVLYNIFDATIVVCFLAGALGWIFTREFTRWVTEAEDSFLVYGTTTFMTTLLGVLFNPLLAIIMTMLYVKTRQAGGATVAEALAKVEK